MSKRILVVDDDPDIMRLVQMVLQDHDYHVTTAGDGQDALAAVAAGAPDLVILDVEMPHVDGFDVLRKLRQKAATVQLPVIMLTGRDQPADMFEGWQTGADLYLTKPFESETLLDAVRRVFVAQSGL